MSVRASFALITVNTSFESGSRRTALVTTLEAVPSLFCDKTIMIVVCLQFEKNLDGELINHLYELIREQKLTLFSSNLCQRLFI